MLNDLISDGLTRIRNASMRRLDATKLLHSNVVESVLIEEDNKKFINVVLKYNEHGKSAINEITKISKPGRRIYQTKDEIKRFKNGYGTVIVSTSKGVMSGIEASKAGVGGEVLCTVW